MLRIKQVESNLKTKSVSVFSEVLGSMEGGQAIKVQADSFFSPEAPQRQVLQPVTPVSWARQFLK